MHNNSNTITNNNHSPYDTISTIMSQYKNNIRYHPPSSLSSSSAPKRRRNSKNRYILTLQMYHFPGDTPLKSEYKIASLTVGLDVKLTVDDDMTANAVTEQILELLLQKYSSATRHDFIDGYDLYEKEKRVRNIKKVTSSTSTKYDGRFMRTLAGNTKTLHFVMKSRIPGAPLNVRRQISDYAAHSSGGSDSENDPIITYNTSANTNIFTSDNFNTADSSTTINRCQPTSSRAPTPPTEPQQPTVVTQLPNILVDVPHKIKGCNIDDADTEILSLVRIFLYNIYFSDALRKAGTAKLNQGKLTDFEVSMLQFLYAETTDPQPHKNIIEEIIANYNQKMGKDSPRSSAFLQTLNSLSGDASWDDFFIILTTSSLISKYFNENGDKETLYHDRYVFPVQEDFYEKRLLEVFFSKCLHAQSVDADIPIAVIEECGDAEINRIQYFTAVPTMLILVPEIPNSGWHIERKFQQKRLEHLYSCSKEDFSLQSLMVSKDNVYFCIIINGDQCKVTYKNKEFILASDDVIAEIGNFNVHLAVYSKLVVNNITDDLLPITNEVKMVGKRLQEKVLARGSTSTNSNDDTPINNMESKVTERMLGIYGQNKLKQHLSATIRHIHFSLLRGNSTNGLRAKMHMVLTGNPGVGKTEIAKRMAAIFHDIGITKSANLVVATSADLVAQYIGQTAQTTRMIIKKASSGTLFVDEAYTLEPKSEKSFSKEAVEEIMNHLLSPSTEVPVFIFAGYRAEMERFLSINPGLKRRIPNIFHLEDYTAQELAEITEIKLHQLKMEFPINADLASQFSKIPFDVRKIHNAGLCEKLIDYAMHAQEARLPPNINLLIMSSSL